MHRVNTYLLSYALCFWLSVAREHEELFALSLELCDGLGSMWRECVGERYDGDELRSLRHIDERASEVAKGDRLNATLGNPRGASYA